MLGLPLKRGREEDDQTVSYYRPSGAREIIFGVLVIGFLLWRVCTHLFLSGKEFSFWPTSKRRGVWARTVKRGLVPTVKWREYPLEGGAEGSICTVSPKETIHLSLGTFLMFVQLQ